MTKYCPMKMKCLDEMPTCESCKKAYRVDLVQEDGFEWEHIPQGFFDSLEDAVKLSNSLKEKGFEYVALVHNLSRAQGV